MLFRNRYMAILPLIISSIFAITSGAMAQTPDSTVTIKRSIDPQVKYFYVHGSLGASFDVYKSSDIESMVPEEMDIHAIGFPFLLGIYGGFMNIAQIEFDKYSTSAHNIGTGGFINGQIVTVSVPMKLKETDVLFKVNPAAWTWGKSTSGKPISCLFLIYGSSNLNYRDQTGDGFEGSGAIYGLEWAGISKYFSFSLGAVSHKIKYDEARFYQIDVPSEVKAGQFMMYVRFGLGYGM